MKIQLIGQALDEIKEEDQKDLSKLEDRVKEIELEYSKRSEVVTKLKREFESLEELDILSKNIIKRIHMILPMIEIPLGAAIIISAIASFIPESLLALMLGIALISGTDALITLVNEYPKILDESKLGLKAYYMTFKRLLLSRHDVRKILVKVYNDLLDANNEAYACSRELIETKGMADCIKRELLHLEGYICSVEYIVEKQYFEELRDTSDIVQFINKKRELKKVISE